MAEGNNNYSQFIEIFQQILNNSPIYIFVKDSSMRSLYLSQNYEKMLGKPLKELLGKTMNELFPSELASRMVADDKRVIKEGRIVTVEEEFNQRFYSTTKFPIMIDGNAVYLAGYTIDITEKIKAERDLKKSEQIHRMIAELSMDYLFRLKVSDGGKIKMEYISDNYFLITGRSEQTVSTIESWAEFIHPDDMEKLLVLLNDMKRKPMSCSFECRSLYKDDRERIVSVIAKSEKGKSGKVESIMGAVKDITDKKRYENALQNMQKLESIGVLAGGIAHDFNNLMSGIFQNVDMACHVNRDSVVAIYLENVMKTLERARGLTMQLLTFAKGGAPFQKAGDLFPFVEDTVRFALSGSSLTCRFNIEKGLHSAYYDRTQIAQVIDNIVINAKHAMPQGGFIDVSAENVLIDRKGHPVLQKGRYVRISVKDFGVGIKKDVMNRIFDPFFTTRSSGHGLGLAIAYSIISKHGGCIDAESEPGKGSVFHIYLPAWKGAPACPEDKTAGIPRGNGRVLLMDDEEIIRNTVHNMLNTLGYTVETSENGTQVLDIYKKHGPGYFSFMMLDLTVPGGMGGRETLEEIRRIDKIIPAFVLSGYSDDPVINDPEKFGFTASICKPFTLKEVAGMLDKYLKKFHCTS